MRIKKNINLGIINWSNATFSVDLGVKGLTQWKEGSEKSAHK